MCVIWVGTSQTVIKKHFHAVAWDNSLSSSPSPPAPCLLCNGSICRRQMRNLKLWCLFIFFFVLLYSLSSSFILTPRLDSVSAPPLKSLYDFVFYSSSPTSSPHSCLSFVVCIEIFAPHFEFYHSDWIRVGPLGCRPPGGGLVVTPPSLMIAGRTWAKLVESVMWCCDWQLSTAHVWVLLCQLQLRLLSPAKRQLWCPGCFDFILYNGKKWRCITLHYLYQWFNGLEWVERREHEG